LERENKKLNEDNQLLQSQLLSLTNEVKSSEIEIPRKPKSDWKEYFPSTLETTLLGETKNKVENLLGIPPVLARDTATKSSESKEVWIYYPYDTDSTGLYIY